MGSRKIDLVKQTFGRLTVQMDAGRDCRGEVIWLCQCSCGNMCKVKGSKLRRDEVRSCKCLSKELKTTHGMSDSREYGIWLGMKNRCLNPNQAEYRNYGGRGIEVCER